MASPGKSGECEKSLDLDPLLSRKQFLKMHWDTLYACDFFSVEALSSFGTVRYMDDRPVYRSIDNRQWKTATLPTRSQGRSTRRGRVRPSLRRFQ